jgi:hypothetical protein
MGGSIMEIEVGQWKEIPNYEGYYQTNILGEIKSLSRIVKCKGNKTKTNKQRILKQGLGLDGYLQVSLSKNGEIKSHRVSRLVALTFIPNFENKPQVNHINGIKTDNRVLNLEWVTAKENNSHAIINGLKSVLSIELYNAKLNDRQDVFDILKLYKKGVKQVDIAKIYNVDKTTINKIVLQKSYKVQELIQVGDMVEYDMHYYTTFKEIVYNNKQDQPMIRMATSSGSESIVVNSNRIVKIYTPNKDKSQYTLQWSIEV